MKLNQKISLNIFLMFILLSMQVFSSTTYNQTGNNNGLFQNGRNLISDLTSTPTIGLVGLTDGRYSPLVSDLDNDGENEIIVVDDIEIKLFHDSTLTPVNAFTIGTADTSTPIIYDIDGDSRPEIIIADNDNQLIQILEYNGTSFFNQSTLEYTPLSFSNGDQVFQCRATNDCLIVYTDDSDNPNPQDGLLMSNVFNSTFVFNRTIIDTTTGSFGAFCLPFINRMTASDYDADGNIEYLVNAISTNSVNIVDIEIWALNINTNRTATSELNILEGSPEFSGVINGNCDSNPSDKRSFVTPLMVADIDGLANQKEIIMAYQTDADDYEISAYTKTGSDFDTYPLSADANGQIISNLFEINHDPDDTTFQFCVIGNNDAGGDSEITCVNEGRFVETSIFSYTPSGTISGESAGIFVQNAHSVDSITQAQNTDEILFVHGIYSLDLSGAFCGSPTWECNTQVEYSITGNQSWVSVDVEKIGLEDLIGMDDDFIYYIDDGLVNHPATITHYSVNPCLDSVWKINTTVQVTITTTDPDGDSISQRAVLYSGDSNEQDSGFTQNLSSGQTSAFSFIANKSIGNSALELFGKDSVNMNIDNIPLSFSVSSNGVEFGDCVSDVDIEDEPTPANESEILQESEQDNSISSPVNRLSARTGLSGTIIWILIIIAVSLIIAYFSFKVDMPIGIVATIESIAIIGLFVIGAYLGFISKNLIIIFVVIATAIIIFMGILFRQK